MDPKTMTGDEIVISGMAGKFPESKNIAEFQQNLLDGKDCITAENFRWEVGHPQIPKRTGKIDGVSKCDSTFFSIHSRGAHQMEPMMRMMLETAYEAVIDAGINPRTLRGKKTGVYMSSSWSDCEKIVMYGRLKAELNGLVIAGVSRAMFANRITFFLGLNGPSYNIDTGCTGSLAALEQARDAIRDGVIENAIVGAAYLALHPHMAIQLNHAGLVSLEGITRSFDDNACGYAFSEAIGVLFLQKSKDAKRIYAEVLDVQSLHGPSVTTGAIIHPTYEFQKEVMERTLKGAKISAKDISYVEADGLGVRDADAREVRAIDEVYNKGRDSPLLMGSVKSVIGHSNSTNGIASIIKVLIAMETGTIPKNLHYEKPSALIPALREGRLKVVTEPTPWEGTYAAVNCTSFIGTAAHVILKSHKKKKTNVGKLTNGLPRLMTVSGRTKEAVETIINDLDARPYDADMLQLINDIFEIDIASHLYRGYTVLPPEGPREKKIRDIQHCPDRQKEIWFVYTGMGSQWAGMGESLLQLPVFLAAVKKCDAVLKPHGYDIFKILTEKDPEIFEFIIHSFIGIAAVQIGLTDVLRSIGIVPNFLIGHSVGELGCAYADGCLTAEEMVLSALYRGLASVESDLIPGLMAAVGLSYEEVKQLCPPDIDVACHNSSTSSTISGPAESMRKFVKQLTDKGIFAREVNCSNIAYHSRYIKPAGDNLLNKLKTIVKTPKPRSSRWLSTSVPRSDWSSGRCRLSSPEYYTNNLLSPVLFAETSKAIPEGAIAIEIAPHGLLQAILVKSLPKSVINIPLTQRGHANNVEVLMAAIGKMYNAGLQPDVSSFYPKIEYPVARATPSISSLWKWDHSIDLLTETFRPVEAFASGEKTFEIDITKDEYKYLEGHNINGRIVIPPALYLSLVWDMMQMFIEDDVAIIFEDVKIRPHQVKVPEKGIVNLTVMVQRGTGKFEVTSDSKLLASGGIKSDQTLLERIQVPETAPSSKEELSKFDVYTELGLRGLRYSGPFMSIVKSSMNRDMGIIQCSQNLTVLLDSMIQMFVLGTDDRRTKAPLGIRKIIIDIKQLGTLMETSEETLVCINHQFNMLKANPVDMVGITLQTILPETTSVEEGFRMSPEIPPLCTTSTWQASQLIPGNLESIAWTNGPPISDQEAASLARVEYSTIHHQDLSPLTEELLSEAIETSRAKPKTFGLEYSGTDARGRRIMGISESGTLSSHASIHPEYTWPVPDSWSLEEAATVPLAYGVAYGALCLYETRNWYSLEDNKSVLIMDGCSSLGQAAINVSLQHKWGIFTTYVTEEERKFIRAKFPQIQESNILSAETTGFRDQLLAKTEGGGVAIVFCNSCNPKIVETYLSCIQRGGHFVFVGELEDAVTQSLGMAIFWMEVIVSAFNLKKILADDARVKRILSTMVEEGIKKGAVKPISHVVYNRDELQDAITAAATRSNLGSTVIKTQAANSKKAPALRRLYALPSKSYVIIDGVSVFGFELADFLVSRGAKNIVVTSSSKCSRNFYKLRAATWVKDGVNVILRENVDLTKKENLESLLKETTAMGPVDAIFDLQRLNSKISSDKRNSSTKVLDAVSRKACPELRHFVLCAKVEKQEDEVAAALCRQRIKDGLSGILVLWDKIDLDDIVDEIAAKQNLNKPTIPQSVEQFDRIVGSDIQTTKVSYQEAVETEKLKEDLGPEVEESEHEKFNKYIFQTDATKDYTTRPLETLL